MGQTADSETVIIPTTSALSSLAGGSYSTLPDSGGSNAVNYKMTGGTILAGSFSVNTLKLENPGGDLAFGGSICTGNTTNSAVTLTFLKKFASISVNNGATVIPHFNTASGTITLDITTLKPGDTAVFIF